MSHPGRLENKVAIVTGAGLGLGEAITRKFVFEGARVVLFEINPTNADKVAASLPIDTSAVFAGDVTKQEDWDKCLKFTLETFGELHIVVNNAGVVHRAGPSHETPWAEYTRVMHTNVSPLYLSLSAIQPYFLSRSTTSTTSPPSSSSPSPSSSSSSPSAGVFVNLSSISAPRPRPHLVWYAGSKGAVSAITKGLAAELAPRGIRVNAVCPVIAETGMVANVLGGVDTVEGRAKVRGGIPLGRFARGEDVANAVAWLAGDEASFITGIELFVDGGRSLQ